MKYENNENIERAQNGDLGAFRKIIEQHSQKIYSIAYQMAGNSDDASDIAQEVFIKLFNSLGKFDRKYNFTTWLYRVTVNMSIDYKRKNTRHSNIPLDEINETSIIGNCSSEPDSGLERKELKGIINKVTELLTEKQQKVFVLRDLQGFSTEEISQILTCRQSTVRVHLAKAREQVRNELMKYYPERLNIKANREDNR
ncbi:RNA polymerase sigma factor [candidate division KSB1 bacterium]